MRELRDYFECLFQDIKRLQEANKQLGSGLNYPCSWYLYLKATRGLFAPANETTMGYGLATPAKARIAATLTNHLRLMHAVAIDLKQRRPAGRVISSARGARVDRPTLFIRFGTLLMDLLVKILPEMVVPTEYGKIQNLCKTNWIDTVNDELIFSLACTAESMSDWHQHLNTEAGVEFIKFRQIENPFPADYSRKIVVLPPTNLEFTVFTHPVETDPSYLKEREYLTPIEERVLRKLKGVLLTKEALRASFRNKPAGTTIIRICKKLKGLGLVAKKTGGGYYSVKFPPSPDQF
jgi:hypothetical protein